MKNSFARCLAACALWVATTAGAQAPIYTITQIGAVFHEPPPGREKALAGFGGVMEKVETTVVVSFKNRIIAELPFLDGESRLTAHALLANGSAFPLGTVDGNRGFRPISEDKRKTSLTLGVNRLPDQATKGVRFSGTVKLGLASGLSSKVLTLTRKQGAPLDFGLGAVSISSMDGNSITLAGGDPLSRLQGVKFIKPDGSSAIAERGSYSRIGASAGSKLEVQWRFNVPVGPGRYEFLVYKDLEEFDLPVDLVVAKPY